MTNDSGTGPETGTTLARGVLLIVAAGVALGIGFNALQHSAGSQRALAWVGREAQLASLEEVSAERPTGGVLEPGTTAAADGADPGPAGGAAAEADANPAADGPRTSEAGTSSRPAAPGSGPDRRETPATRAAPAGEAAPAPAPGLPPIPDTREPLEVQYSTVKKFHDAGAAVFVDARSLDEYAAGHIAGARHLSADAVFEDPALAAGLDTQGRPIITYCSSADCNLSRDLAFALIEGGHRKVLVYKAGIAGWEAEGQPLVPGAAPGGASP